MSCLGCATPDGDGVLLSEAIPDEGTLTLTATELSQSRSGTIVKIVSVADAIGVQADGDTLVVHSAPLRKRSPFSAASRKLKGDRFMCASGAQAQSWADALRKSIAGNGKPGVSWLVLVNPVSGKRRGAKVLVDCRPYFEAAGVPLREVITTHAGHAGEIVASLDVSSVSAVVCVGGDGIVHEVVNALMARADAARVAASLPIGVIPAGSGNSLATSLLKAAGEPCDVASAAFRLVRGGRQPLDLWQVSQPGKSGYAFLSLEWALASDIDIGSEKLRWLGALPRAPLNRPTVGASGAAV